jgi:hypothetical protein
MADVMKEDDEDIKDKDDVIIVEEDPANKASAEDDHDDDDQDDERSAKADDGDEDEREAIRERRRQEKQERKERRDKAISRDKLELDFLRKRNDDLERRLTVQEQRTQQLDVNGIDAQIQKAQNDAQMADRIIAKAVEAGNGDDVTQALRYRDEAISKVQQLTYAKQQAQQKAPVSDGIDDVTAYYAKQFMDNNKWYDPQGRNEDSAIVMAIDNALSKDGYDPRTEDYWVELERRAARRLPERFGKQTRERDRDDDYEDKQERKPRGGPAVGSGREHAPTSTRKEIYLSPDRKQALIDAGVWDDPVLRMRYAKRYAEYDKANKA